MLHSHYNNNRIKYLHEKCHRLNYNDKRFLYKKKFLQKDGSVSIQPKNNQEISIETFKVKRSLAPKIVKDSFVESNENQYNLRNQKDSRRPPRRTIYPCCEPLLFKSKNSENYSRKILFLVSIDSFKKPVRKWISENCPYRLGKQYQAFL